MSNVKYVYTFGGKTAEGKADMKNLLGGKGANLAEMCLLGLPVPAGLTITTECCTAYYANNCQLPDHLMADVWKAMENVEKIMGRKYDDPENPLLVSCRSGARTSMPGMMDTVLNIGLSSKTIPGPLTRTTVVSPHTSTARPTISPNSSSPSWTISPCSASAPSLPTRPSCLCLTDSTP